MNLTGKQSDQSVLFCLWSTLIIVKFKGIQFVKAVLLKVFFPLRVKKP